MACYGFVILLKFGFRLIFDIYQYQGGIRRDVFPALCLLADP